MELMLLLLSPLFLLSFVLPDDAIDNCNGENAVGSGKGCFFQWHPGSILPVAVTDLE